ncbi:GTP cyclohydrolase II [Jannaschia sp. W003]|uniref:GTP cyclohydrolase II n=1 Tax=Jannaschia sp. W003 TaxID=2867012 RepID=UPI0021A715D3|nr:GTP cyclohydrolase II [Jannaschia sp. W003]UWQ22124.1 GTP cyclohydrolase II [Jannaschia sp. W003]
MFHEGTSLGPDGDELAARARADLRIGLPVAAGGVVLGAAETLGAGRLAAMRALGPLRMAVTGRRAATLKVAAYGGDLALLEVPEGADAAWLRAVADPADDLRAPLKGPLRADRDADPAPWRTGLTLAKAAQLLPAVVGVLAPPPPGVTVLDGAPTPGAPAPVAAARLPMALAGAGRLHVFREGLGGEEHYAVEAGTVDRSAPVLVRLHSACFTGDVLGSLKCDCGPQLHAALAAIREGGVVLYLNQEGRGIGLANKMRAYDLQDQGFDTVEANHRLGFEDDERDFRLGAALLERLGIRRIRLMTNNPRKIEMMRAQGVEVTERVPLHVGRGADNAAYLDVKRAKSGHLE